MQILSKVRIISLKISDLIKNNTNIKTLLIDNSFINEKTIEAFTERTNTNQKL